MSDGFTDQDRNQLHEFIGRVDEKLSNLPCEKTKESIIKLDRRVSKIEAKAGIFGVIGAGFVIAGRYLWMQIVKGE